MKIEELQKLCDEATPGPWRWAFAHPGHLLGSYATTAEDHMIHCVLDGIFDPNDLNDCNVSANKEDRDFIAAARSALPKLIALANVCKDVIEHGYHRSRLIAAVEAVETTT